MGRAAERAGVSRQSDLWIAALVLAVLVPARLFEVSGNGLALHGEPLGVVCWLRALTGVACPFCGMTRSVVALAHFDVAGSLAFHPGGIFIGALLIVSLGGVVWFAVRGQAPLWPRPGYRRFVEVVALVCLVLGASRAII